MTTAPTPHLRALAEAVKAWTCCNEAWPHAEHFDVAVVGGITEGEQYPVSQIDADTYGTDGESLKLAQFYAAANPGAVLALLDRIDALQADNERLRGDYALRGAQIQRMAALIDELEGKVGRFQGIPLSLIEAINAATGSNDWQGDHSPAELLGPACRAITALVERKNACIHKLEMDALDLASENSILKRAKTDELEARKPLPLSYRAGAMTSSIDGGATVSLHFNDMAEAEAWFVAITDQHDAALASKAAGPLPGITGGSS